MAGSSRNTNLPLNFFAASEFSAASRRPGHRLIFTV
jgi:hypothetical protein